jgi:hypothetical protein
LKLASKGLEWKKRPKVNQDDFCLKYAPKAVEQWKNWRFNGKFYLALKLLLG